MDSFTINPTPQELEIERLRKALNRAQETLNAIGEGDGSRHVRWAAEKALVDIQKIMGEANGQH